MNVIFRLGELFCGSGGIVLGAKWASRQTKSSTKYAVIADKTNPQK
jgi:hypothetical protein